RREPGPRPRQPPGRRPQARRPPAAPPGGRQALAAPLPPVPEPVLVGAEALLAAAAGGLLERPSAVAAAVLGGRLRLVPHGGSVTNDRTNGRASPFRCRTSCRVRQQHRHPRPVP